jgi:ketol-acid reductoisomerase
MRDILAEIRAGRFTEELQREEASGYARLRKARAAARETLLEQTSGRLRGD